MKILFATDGSRSAEIALERLSGLLGQAGHPDDLAVVLVAVSPGRPAGAGRADGHRDAASAIASLARSKEILARQGIVPKSIWRVGQDPAGVILDLASREHADLVVLGSRPRSPVETPMGGVSDQVLKRSALPVLVVKPPAA